jgi:hypothetical protein
MRCVKQQKTHLSSLLKFLRTNAHNKGRGGGEKPLKSIPSLIRSSRFLAFIQQEKARLFAQSFARGRRLWRLLNTTSLMYYSVGVITSTPTHINN